MQQLTLFPEPELDNVYAFAHLKPAEKRRLEEIALEASNHELFRGEPTTIFGVRTGQLLADENRLTKILDYLHEKVGGTDLHLIRYGEEIIGAAHVWDGWLAMEMDFSKPEIELAYLHPQYQNLASLVENKLRALLSDVEKGQIDG